jgi:hypothetical protein
MLLAKIFYRPFRCESCGRLFDLPLCDVTAPPHARRGYAAEACEGTAVVPA